MNRLALLLAMVGVLLLTTWAIAPASPPAHPSPKLDATLEQTAPVLAEVNRQVERLRERLNTPPAFPEPTRDPFRFGRRPEPAKPKPVVEPPPVVETPAPVLPRLVAVVADVKDGGLLRTAFLSNGDELQSYKPGDVVGEFIIRSIGADAVELVDAASGATYRITLR